MVGESSLRLLVISEERSGRKFIVVERAAAGGKPRARNHEKLP